MPLSTITLTIPSGTKGVRAASGGQLAKSVTQSFQITNGSILRLQQLLSILDYSPLSWTPSGSAISATNNAAETRALFTPPSGTFTWLNHGWPRALLRHWQPATYNVFTRGLVMSFEADHGLNPNGHINAQLWSTLMNAVAQNLVNTGGYNYAYANKAAPEHLTIYHNGTVVLTSPANTGITSSPTPDGTFPVNTRLRSQIMRGSNPNGQKYADLVQYIAYFHGNDAVHYMSRADYGIPQSLGCIELPLADAAKAWPYLAYGTLVTVVN
jgi:lipoprotein-anchoring transpeptidase ErfK/SrfK